MTWSRALVVAAVALGVVSLSWSSAIDRALNPTDPHEAADFPNYYFGGERWLDDRPVYDILDEEIEALFGVEGYDTYPADPPTTVVLFSPLSSLSYETAWKVWQAISALLAFGAVVIVSRECGYSPQWAVVFASLAFLTTPVRFLLERNHMESVLLILGVLGWRALRRSSSLRGSVFWGLATGLKLFPGMWLVGFARTDRRRTIVGLGLAVGLLVVGAVALGWSNVEQFIDETVPGSRRWYGVLGNYSLVSLGTAFVAPWLGWIATVAALGWLLPKYLNGNDFADRVYVLGTSVALLVSPLSWLNYFVLVIPALVILSCHLDLAGESSHRIGFTALVVPLMFWGPIVTDSEYVSLVLSYLPTLALLALFLIGHRHIKEAPWLSTSETEPQPTN